MARRDIRTKTTTTARTLAALNRYLNLRKKHLYGCGRKQCDGTCSNKGIPHLVNSKILERRIVISARDQGNGLIEIRVRPKVNRNQSGEIEQASDIIGPPIVFYYGYLEASLLAEDLDAYAKKNPQLLKRNIYGVSFLVHVLRAYLHISELYAVEVKEGSSKGRLNVVLRKMRGIPVNQLAASQFGPSNLSVRLKKRTNRSACYIDYIYPGAERPASRDPITGSLMHPMRNSIWSKPTQRSFAPLLNSLTKMYERKNSQPPHPVDCANGIRLTYGPIWNQVLDSRGVSSRPAKPPTVEEVMYNIKPDKKTVNPTIPGLKSRGSSIMAELNALVGEYSRLSIGRVGKYLTGLTYKSEVAGIMSSYIQFSCTPKNNTIIVRLQQPAERSLEVVAHLRTPPLNYDSIRYTVPTSLNEGNQTACFGIPEEWIDQDVVVLVYRPMNSTADPDISKEVRSEGDCKVLLYQAQSHLMPRMVLLEPITRECSIPRCTGKAHIVVQPQNKSVCADHAINLANNKRVYDPGTLISLNYSHAAFYPYHAERATHTEEGNSPNVRLIFLTPTINLMASRLVRGEQDRTARHQFLLKGESDLGFKMAVEHNVYQDRRRFFADDNQRHDQTVSETMKIINTMCKCIMRRPDPSTQEYRSWKVESAREIATSFSVIPFSEHLVAEIPWNSSGEPQTEDTNSKIVAIEQASFVSHAHRTCTDEKMRPVLAELLELKPRTIKGPPIEFDTDEPPDPGDLAYLRHKFRDFELERPGFGRTLLGDDKGFSYPYFPKLDEYLGLDKWLKYNNSLGHDTKKGSTFFGVTNLSKRITCISSSRAAPLPAPSSLKVGGKSLELQLYAVTPRGPRVLLHNPIHDPTRSLIRRPFHKSRFRDYTREEQLVSGYYAIGATSGMFSDTQTFYKSLFGIQALALAHELQIQGIDPNDPTIMTPEIEETMRYKGFKGRVADLLRETHPIIKWADEALAQEEKVLMKIRTPENPSMAPDTLLQQFGLDAATINVYNVSMHYAWHSLSVLAL